MRDPVDITRDENGLTLRQRMFVEEYPKDWNGTQAAIRAGYSPQTAHATAYDLKKMPKIVDAITAKLAEQVTTPPSVDRKWVLARLVEAEREASETIGAKGKGASQARLHRLKALELIGKHVDVGAFRTQFTIGTDDGQERQWDLSKLDDEELNTFERLLDKISVESGRPGGATAPDAPDRPGEAGDVEGSDPS